ncbi:MAG: ATP-binding protein [Myxococcaceae bacterium]
MFGPRGVGKTWLLRNLFEAPLRADPPHAVVLDLLHQQPYLDLLSEPARIRRYLPKPDTDRPFWVIVDEVQRVPHLLSEVHSILEDPDFAQYRFVLTGSSARKLRRGGADLLAGRALVNHLYSLSALETGDSWELEQTLRWGSLPGVVTAASDELRREILRAYVGTYIREEIKEEQVLRKLEPFIRFLEVAAQANGEPVVYSKIADRAQVDAKAVARYFEVLEDTLIGFLLPPYTRSARDRALSLSKFYFFDVGVKNAIERTVGNVLPTGSSLWGRAFEHAIILEFVRLNAYQKRDDRFSHFRTKDGAEIDLVVERGRQKPLCVEIKSGRSIQDTEVRRLKRTTAAIPGGVPQILYDGHLEQEIEGVNVTPWKLFLTRWYRTSGL